MKWKRSITCTKDPIVARYVCCVRVSDFFFFLFTACMIFLGCKTWQSCPQWLGIELWDKHAKFRTISLCLWGLPESNLPVPHPRAWTSARVGGGGRGAGEWGMPALQPETNKTGETQRTPSLYPAQQELSKLNILKLLHRGSSWVSRAQLSALTTIWPLRCKCDWCRRARPRVAAGAAGSKRCYLHRCVPRALGFFLAAHSRHPSKE